MNERIKELSKQALDYANQCDAESWDSAYERKFAELIVKECLSQADKVFTMLDDDKEKTGVAWVGLAIAKHFGLE